MMLTVAISRSKILRMALTDQAEKFQAFSLWFHKITEQLSTKRTSEGHPVQPLAQRRAISTLDKAAQGLAQLSLENLRSGIFHSLSEHLFQHLTSLIVIFLSFCPVKFSLLATCDHCPSSFCCAISQKSLARPSYYHLLRPRLDPP